MIPVLEVGGTHVSAALVDPGSWTVHRTTRLPLDSTASAHALIAHLVHAATSVVGPAGATWGVAMPDPFDYVGGVGSFAGVGKFGALDGVDVGAALLERIVPSAARLRFLNDADAFALGEWAAGAGRGAARLAAITLGTGVGSGWLVNGMISDPGTPAGGRIHTQQVRGVPLEDIVSRRAIRRSFVRNGGDASADVREIADLARLGAGGARRVLDEAFAVLGEVVAGCVTDFGADVLVVGGSMAASWDLFEAAFRRGAGARLPEVRLALDADRSALVGAALHAKRAALPA